MKKQVFVKKSISQFFAVFWPYMASRGRDVSHKHKQPAFGLGRMSGHLWLRVLGGQAPGMKSENREPNSNYYTIGAL